MFRPCKFHAIAAMLAMAFLTIPACDITISGLDDLIDDLDPIGLPPGNATPADDTAAGSQALFDELWQTFDENYAYFDYKGIDWDEIRERHRPAFAGDLNDDEFVDGIVAMLSELADWHVEVMHPNGTWRGTEQQEVRLNYTSTPRNRYTLNDSGYESIADGVIRHAWYADNIAYIRVDTLATTAFEAISDQTIEDLFAHYASADAMILDIRPNNGGNENIAAKFACHFTSVETIYGFTETRNGPDHWDFAPLETKTLQPAAANRFSGPVACLIGQRCLSSAEWFALMMRSCPNVVLVGDTTRGGSGFPREFELANGMRYTVPRWIAYTADLEGIEDIGIDPDVWIAADESFDESHDYVVEEAIALLTQ